MLPPEFRRSVIDILGSAFVRDDAEAFDVYGADALKRGHAPDLVGLPATAAEVSALATLCNAHRVPLVVRGGGTGYTGGAVPVRGGLVLSMERMNRILAIDAHNLLAVVQPNVVTGDLQDAVERVGLFYPPDPASLRESVISGNVAECAGGPRAFKYGTTKRYVLALEAVLPTGEVIRTGSKAVKNVVGYDLTQLLCGSEGTLAILTEITLRLVPKPAVQTTLRATFREVREAVEAVDRLVEARVVPAALELVDGESL
ncbi:MAG: FAD-binding oxidoreductase, partial [Bacteroidales bacterium]